MREAWETFRNEWPTVILGLLLFLLLLPFYLGCIVWNWLMKATKQRWEELIEDLIHHTESAGARDLTSAQVKPRAPRA